MGTRPWGCCCDRGGNGPRAGDWLLDLAGGARTFVEIAFDYAMDYELLEYSVREAGLWDRVRDVAVPVNVAALTSSVGGQFAAERCCRGLARRGLKPHHALADALALRAAYLAVKAAPLGSADVSTPATEQLHLLMKHTGSRLADTKVKVVIHRQEMLVTLEPSAIDTRHLLTVLSTVLPEKGVVAYADEGQGFAPPPAPYRLRVLFGDRYHRAYAAKLFDGNFALRIEPPDAAAPELQIRQ